jgi:hypothetical protein
MELAEDDPDSLDGMQFPLSPSSSSFREDIESPEFSHEQLQNLKALDRSFSRWRAALETLSKEPLYEIYTEKGLDPRLKLDLSQSFNSRAAMDLVSTDATLKAALSGRHHFWRNPNPIDSAFIRSGFKSTSVRQNTSIMEMSFQCELGTAFSVRIPSPVVVVCSLEQKSLREVEEGGTEQHWQEIFRYYVHLETFSRENILNTCRQDRDKGARDLAAVCTHPPSPTANG